ncbi:MAG: efflux transporter outer membrane subunit [Deltaproteobacteria bacterium]|nr:efflux transporter outer membrane subunit [Deltaproteobacteria bacterium]
MNMTIKTNPIRLLVWLSKVLAVLILSGCATVGPDYVPLDTMVSKGWHTPLDSGLTVEEIDPQALAAWWNTLNDQELSSLITRAVKGNLDIKEARARIREARVRRGAARADLFPTLDATSSATWSRSSENTGPGETRDFYAAGFDAGWELDLFGGAQRSVEAADADLDATQENLHDVLVSLTAEVALNYIEVRIYQKRLSVKVANLEIQQETYRLIQSRYQAGLNDELAVQQARSNLESTRSQVPTLRISLQESLNRIAVLLGEQPGGLHKELKEYLPIPLVPLKVAVGVPANVLRRRPDIRKAERQVAAQTARIGVATAELYPKFTLSGSIGLEALSLGNLFEAGSSTFRIGPRITWPIFNAGSIRANIEVQSAIQEQTMIQYESTVLSALEEVENALVAYVEEQIRRASLEKAVDAAKQVLKLARYKYQTGLIDFITVLDAQRSLLTYEDQLVQSAGSITSNLVRLYKALGGGWISLAPDKEYELRS